MRTEKFNLCKSTKKLLTLITLLTLGVGQMWAYDAHFSLMGDPLDNSWANDRKFMINTGTGTTDEWYIYAYVAKNQYFALNNGSDQYGPGTNGKEIKNGSGGGQGAYNTNSWKFTGTSGIVKICCAESSNREWNPWVWVEESAPTIKFKHPWNGGSWTEQTAALQGNGTYRYKGQYGGTEGFNAGYSSNYKYNASATTVTGSPASGDYCYFIWNPVGYVRGTQDYNNGNSQNVCTGTFTIVKLCNITYQGNGKTSGTVPSAQNDNPSGTAVTLSNGGNLAKTGYTLTGWNTASDGSGTHYALSGSFTPSTETSLTLYAEWTQTITVDVNTGTSAGSMSIYFNATSLKTFTAATKTNWILDGYWTSSDNSGSKVIDYDASTGTASLVSSLSGYITTGKWTRASATTLYAHWKQTYTVTYNANYPASATSTSGSVPTDATEYASGATVTVKSNSGSLAAGGYTFAGWQTEPTGGTSYVAGSGTFSITEPTTLYAKWTENMRSVTISVSPSGAGTLNKTSASVGVATTTTVTATPYPGWRFSSWSPTNCSVASTSSKSTTLSGNGTSGSGTLVANHTQTYAYLQGRMTIYTAVARSTKKHIASSEGGWDKSSNRIKMDYDGTNHRFYLHTYMKPSELSAQQSSEYQWFSFKTSTNSSTLTSPQAFEPASNQEMTTTGSANKKTVSAASTDKHIRFNSSVTNGYAILYFDESGVWYELEHSLTYDKNGGSGTPTATACYNNGTNATAADGTGISKSQYSFAGWNTEQYITGTNYAAGASVPMSANTTLYAKWTRSITLNQNGATTDGSNSVTATYNCATLPTISNPSKLGYTFGGWYTANNGTGSEVINTSGTLQTSKSGWTDGSGRFTRTESGATLYAKWTQTITLNYNPSYHGSGSNKNATVILNATALSSITHCTPATGYQLEGYYTAASGGTKILKATGTFEGSDITVDAVAYISSGKWVKAGATTLYAHYTPITYNITLSHGEGGSGSGTATIAYDATSFTTFVDGGITQTGYHISGWYAPSSSTKVLNDDHSFASTSISGYITDGKWSKAANCELQAWWDPDNYTVTLDVDEDHQGTISGATTSHTVTYNTVTTNIPNLPTAEDYYGLDGYYTGQNGAGTKVINGDGTFIASVDGYTDEDAKWIKVGGEDLYAYYKKSEISSLVVSPSTQAPGESVTATPTISPTPEGTTMLCWKLLRANGNLYADDIFSDAGGNAVSFNAPETSGSYKVVCIMRSGNTGCGFGTVLDSVVADLVVAGAHTVTIRYQDGSGRSLAASSSVTGRPLEWSGAIDPETITGYTFDHWVAGDGVTISTDASSAIEGSTTTTSRIYIKATYDGNLTAVYNKKNVIYFNNTLGWNDVYVYFYNTSEYWDNTYGSGALKTQQFNGDHKPYWEEEHGHMTQIEGTDIWYFDYTAAGYSTRANVVFTKDNKHNTQWFYQTAAVRRTDHNASLPMFVPLTEKTTTKNQTDYYDHGYWMNYPENTGYTLNIYNNATYGANNLLRSIPFEFTPDKTLPMELTVELSGAYTYGIEIHRADGTVFGKTMTLKSSDNGYDSGKDLTTNQRVGLQTSVAGEYIIKLSYSSETFKIGVKYPASVGDYRIVYKDLATWSQSSAHTSSWNHPSRTIHKENGAKDIVSFYVSKADGANATMKFQYASAIDAEGVVTWTDVTGGSISLTGITESGVYDFHLSQSGGSISVEKIEKYSGNYYIRTDNAGSTKWDNYRAADHQLTYSEFSKSRSTNTFGELYTHYYMHWCPRSTNIKFCIANDYSSCITDTLENDLVDLGNMLSPGWLNSDGASEEYRDKFSANIRFMYHEETNKISRAYLSSSTNKDRKFLVLRSNEEFLNSDGSALNGTGETHDDANNIYEAIFQDNEDWIYEREVKLTPGQLFKIYASYAQATVQEDGSQHFRGKYASNAWTKDETAVELIGGDGAACKARIIYDFKTNRLMAAYLPDNAEISGNLEINADIMVIREHQDAGQQITFANASSQLSEVKTVYGVMRFNRWILNNRQHPEDHVKEHGDSDEHIAEYHPLVDPGSMKSVYERALYWISFPFDVNLSEVFGFGTYGTHWILMDYNGAERARIGYWKDNDEGFWEYIWDRRGVTLEAGRGYVLALELDLMQANDRTFWSNDIQQVELFFPSSSTAGTIKQTAVDVSVESHLCTIDRRTNKDVPDWNNDRRVADSHWNIIGVPSYANYGSELTDGTNTISWHSSPKTNSLPFLYEWNANDNTYTVQSGTRYNFKAMHAYYVQYAGTLHWTLASATPAIVARRTYAEESEDVELKIELQQNEKMIDQTFVKLSNDEEVSANFAFGEDMDKEFNAGKANVYTFIEGYIPSAGNALPMSEQTTIVPVGVSIPTAGEYTFAIPDGTEGVGVILVDNVANTRTNLSALDYTVNLTTGTHDGRFVLEISPIHNATTGIEAVSDEGLEITGARKMIIDQKLYIVKDGKLFDATGKRVE